MKYRILSILFCLMSAQCLHFAQEANASGLTINFKGHKNVWKTPMLSFNNTQGGFLASRKNMVLLSTEGDYNTWQYVVNEPSILALLAADNLSVDIYQSSYTSDYASGQLRTLPYHISQAGTYCLTAGNLRGSANITSDGNGYSTWQYTTGESNYDDEHDDYEGRQEGKLFAIECNDNDHHTYYASLVGKSGNNLRSAIHDLVNRDKRVTTYMALRDAYAVTDYHTYGELWDMYSDRSGTYRHPSGTSGDESESTAQYNREHALPKSWWGHQDGQCEPQFTDIVHVIPANEVVNKARSNYPYGECSNPTRTFGNGSRLGNSTFAGYNKIVYEPADEFKGDIARIYFYMVICYSDVRMTVSNGAYVFSYSSGSSDLMPYSRNLFLKWHRADEVSDKEMVRNDGIQSIQGNRNPFVDLPNLAEYIWGTKAGQPFAFDDNATALTGSQAEACLTTWRSGSALNISSVANASIEVFDVSGRLIMRTPILAGQTLHLATQPGMLIIRATTADDSVFTSKSL